MFRPVLSTGIEKWDEFSCLGIKGTNVRPLVTITAHTGQCKVIGFCFTTVLAGYDVIRFVFVKRNWLWQATVLTTTAGTFRNKQT